MLFPNLNGGKNCKISLGILKQIRHKNLKISLGPYLKIKAASEIGQKEHFFKKRHGKISPPLINYLLRVLH